METKAKTVVSEERKVRQNQLLNIKKKKRLLRIKRKP